MCDMFKNCESLVYLDLSKFNSDKVEYLANFFEGCYKLKRENIKTSDYKILNIIQN